MSANISSLDENTGLINILVEIKLERKKGGGERGPKQRSRNEIVDADTGMETRPFNFSISQCVNRIK